MGRGATVVGRANTDSEVNARGGFLSALKHGSAPFILTVAFAALAWWLTHFVDRVQSAPTVVYYQRHSTSACVDGPCTKGTVYLKNVSNQRLRVVQIELDYQDASAGRFIDGGKIIIEPPMGSAGFGNMENGAILICFDALQPGGLSAYDFTYRGGPPVVRLRSADDPVELTPPSLQTLFADYEMAISGLFVTALVLLSVALLGDKRTLKWTSGLVVLIWIVAVLSPIVFAGENANDSCENHLSFISGNPLRG